MKRRTFLLRIVCCVTALTLAACSQIPVSGPVEEVSMERQDRGVQIAPEPPQKGMSASRVVEGFLQAVADPKGGYSLARQYLSVEAKENWNPEAGALVYEGLVEEENGAFVLQGTTKGSVDAAGRFTIGEEKISHDFALVEEDGEWRISAPPSGVPLSSYIFARSYSAVRSYFVSNETQAVLPDLLHVPKSELTPARIVRAQLAGPSADLSPIVHSAIPTSVTLGAGGATLDSVGTVTVDLDGLPTNLGDEARRELGAQLLWSLSSIQRVTGLKITSGGKPYVLPGQNEQQILELSSQQGYQPLSRASASDLSGVSDQLPGRLSTEDVFVADAGELKPVDMTATSLDGSLTAFVAGDPAVVRVGPTRGSLVSVETALSRASGAQFAQNRLWLIGYNANGEQQMLVVSSQGVVTPIDATALPGEIVDFSVDASGTRVAAIIKGQDGTHCGTAVLMQGHTLSGWHEVDLSPARGVKLSDYVALDWTGELALALVARGAGGPSVFVTRIDGSAVDDLGPISNSPVQVTALPRPGGDAIATRAADGTVLLYQPGSTWRNAKTMMSWISYPG